MRTLLSISVVQNYFNAAMALGPGVNLVWNIFLELLQKDSAQ
jgi:hypothetical protein